MSPVLLKIVQVGDPVLRSAARDLAPEELRSPEIRQLVELMRETMRDAPGVGLAAPQVGMPLRLAVIEDRRVYQEPVGEDGLATRQRHIVPFHVIANPRVTVEDADQAEFFEGCLSLPGFSAVVPRALAVRVDALDHDGEPVTVHARGWYARILQHEIDHLDGTLYVDRMHTRTLTTQAALGRHWSELSIDDVLAKVGGRTPR